MRFAVFAILILCWFSYGTRAATAQPVRGAGYEASLIAGATAADPALRSGAGDGLTRYQRRWIRRWTRAYGWRVGRWADDAARASWPPRTMWTLGRIIRAESNGLPRAYNPSGCAGLLQLAPYWYRTKWHFDPYNPRLNLRYGLRIWRLCGWRAWVTY